ncbi:MAG: NAD(P)-dependent oxidoreductase [Nitrososphaerales archaeon]
MPRVGFIGLGIMGKPMASNIIRKGYVVTVYNRSKKSIEELVALGAERASSPIEVARNSDLVIDMVTDAPDVQEVILGKNGVIEGAREGVIVVDMSTNSPDIATLISSALRKRRVEFLDAPVSGGDKGAREATLTVMVGGKRKVFEKCLPVFQCVGKEIVHMGETGSGQATKLCNQVAVSLHTLATCESLLLGTAAGLKPEALLKVLTSGAASSWNLTNLGPKILSRDFEPGFKAGHLHKDLRYAMQLAERKKLALPGTGIVHQLFNAVLAENYGEKGTQVLARILEKLAKREIRNELEKT